MIYRRLYKTIISTILIISILPVSAYAVTQADIDAVTARRDAVTAEIREQQEILNRLTGQKDEIVDEKIALESEITLAEEQIKLNEQEIDLYSVMIEEKEKEVDEARALEEEQLQKYRNRVRAMEEDGETGILAFILDASSVSELLSRVDDVGEIMESDKRLEDAYIAARENLEAVENEYREYRSELEDKQDVLKEEKAQLEQQVADAQEKLDALMIEIGSNQDLLNEINARWNELNSEVNELQATFNAQHASPGSLSGNGFIWPCGTTFITSRAGNRIHPITGVEKFHSGMDVGCQYGDTVWASASGTVSLASYYSGYGNCVIIKHSNGYSTLYGHLSSIAVSAGQQVNCKDVIGYVGSTGLSTGPHLHFEIRSGDTCLDPESFFPVGSFTFSGDCGE